MKPEPLPPCPSPLRVTEYIHGIEIEDRFRWLEDQNCPLTREFIRGEQNRFDTYLERHSDLRLKIIPRVQELLQTESRGLPISDLRGGLIYEKRGEREEQASLYHLTHSGLEHRILSCDALEQHAHTSLSAFRVSRDGRFLAYGLRYGGEDPQEIRIYDLSRRNPLEDHIPRGLFRGLVFDLKGNGFYYAQEESDVRSVRYHAFGNDQSRDETIFACDPDPSIRLRLLESEDGSALGYTISSLSQASHLRFLLHRFPLDGAPVEITVPAQAELSPRFSGDGIIASTTWHARLGRIVFIDFKAGGPDEWIEIVPESDCRLQAFELLGEKIVVHYCHRSGMRTSIHSFDGASLLQIAYPEGGTIKLGRADSFNNQLFYSYSDVISGHTIYTVNLDSGKTREWWKSGSKWSVIPTIERRSLLTPDGSQVPITIIQPAAERRPRPTVLAVYGSRGVFDTPKFSVVLTILVEAGFNYAIAHIGVANESGSHMERLLSAVEAVSAAAQWLIENRYTTREQLGLAGQSHGALLALCAMATQPNLYRALLALGPIADLTRFHRFGIARWFTQELGSPEDPEHFHVLSNLSPYHRIRQGLQYPAVLIISGDLDKRCDALHARKMVAVLHDSQSRHPILLDYAEHRGHKRGLPISDRIRSLTARLTFLIAELTDW